MPGDPATADGAPADGAKREVWEAWEKVKGNKGAPRVDGCSIADFEADLGTNTGAEYRRGWRCHIS